MRKKEQKLPIEKGKHWNQKSTESQTSSAVTMASAVP